MRYYLYYDNKPKRFVIQIQSRSFTSPFAPSRGIMNITANTALIWYLFVFCSCEVSASVVLSKQIMRLIEKAGNLSAMAYSLKPTEGHVFVDEPDRALFYEGPINGQAYCFVAFRGTTLTWMDWKQNMDPKKKNMCVNVNNIQQCCTTRNGFYDAYAASYIEELEDRLRTCAKKCVNKDECVVLTGHSQVRP
jgi:hypothetical protein